MKNKRFPKGIIFGLGVLFGGSANQTYQSYRAARTVPLKTVVMSPVVVSPSVDFDFDHDGDVDGADFGRFAACYNKSGNLTKCFNGFALTEDGLRADVDNDRDVDLTDFAAFVECYNKSARPPRNCPKSIFVSGRITLENLAN